MSSSRLSPLAAPAFRYFFIGQVVNRAGSSMAGVALAFAVLDINDSASALGLVIAAASVPMVVFMLLGGAIADRLATRSRCSAARTAIATPRSPRADGPSTSRPTAPVWRKGSTAGRPPS